METKTKGNVIVEKIKIGDILYEYTNGFYVETIVMTLPKMDENGFWSWVSVNTSTEESITYYCSPIYNEYNPTLYNYNPDVTTST
jgi:hypothetical protein